ncbi:MAG: hypothetical protein IJO91_04085 [Oscillospiraceae bacterium]|nr:hypothetical protein [Oscillospiraceae bacterium]
MARIKTIILDGNEKAVKITGMNCDVRNDGASTIYASAAPGINVGADGVISVPIGQAVKLHGTNGIIHLFGTGTAMLCGNDYSEPVFKAAATSSGEGGTVDEVARSIATSNSAKITQLEPKIDSISCPNLLINPDFGINQKGVYEHFVTDSSYACDGWKKYMGSHDSGSATISVSDTGMKLTGNSDYCRIYQLVENGVKYAGKPVTLSVMLNEDIVGTVHLMIRYGNSLSNSTIIDEIVTGNAGDIISVTAVLPEQACPIFGVQIYCNPNGAVNMRWCKLEVGTVATGFSVPEPVAELMRCQRYYQIRSSGNISELDLRPTMRTTPVVEDLGDGRFAYNAEM